MLGPTQPSVCKSEMAIEKYRRHINLLYVQVTVHRDNLV
jgi:hypothetical protein